MDILPDWYHNGEEVNDIVKHLPLLYVQQYSLDVYRYYILGRDIVRPEVPIDNWYEVMFDLYTLCDFLNTWYITRPMDKEVINVFMRDNVKYDSYHVEVNVILALFDSRFLHKIHIRLEEHGRVEDEPREVTLNREEYLLKLPFCLRHAIPRRYRELYHIAYPSFDIKCVRSQIQPTKIVNVDPEYGKIYAVRYDTLKMRLAKHLPSVMTGSEFPWKIEGSSCCVAGGFLQCLSNDILYDEEKYKTSDIDLFITGYETKSKELLDKLLTLLESRGYEFEYNNNVINAIPEEGNVIQIICTLNRDVYDIVTTFDNSSVQIGYTGHDDSIICSLDWQKYIQYGQAMVRYSTTGYRIDKMVKRHYVPIREGRLWRKNLERTYDVIDDRYINGMHELSVSKVNITYSPKKKIMFSFFKGSTYEAQEYKDLGKYIITYHKGEFMNRGPVMVKGFFYKDDVIHFLWNEFLKNVLDLPVLDPRMDVLLSTVLTDANDKLYLEGLAWGSYITDIALDPLITLKYGLESWYPTRYMYVYYRFLEYYRRNFHRIRLADRQYECRFYRSIYSVGKNLNIEHGRYLDLTLTTNVKYPENVKVIHVSTPALRE